MIAIAVILLIFGYVFTIAPLVTLGWILLFIGAVLLALGATGRPVLGRRYWY
ncbi:hypothetical protein [Mycobacterium paragordonae]|uniref:hypothetical protein n=1 Tax=Mycobacterium paragordonae TaxID=1389713 RepID=UPI00140D4432|nr:hypothetical protein [Mycobacterium paragordonae]